MFGAGLLGSGDGAKPGAWPSGTEDAGTVAPLRSLCAAPSLYSMYLSSSNERLAWVILSLCEAVCWPMHSVVEGKELTH